MSKKAKLYIAFILASISALFIPIFAQWYYQKTGMYPIGFIFVWVVGGFISIIAIATDNFDGM